MEIGEASSGSTNYSPEEKLLNAALTGNVTFLEDALNGLPRVEWLSLLCNQKDALGNTFLHENVCKILLELLEKNDNTYKKTVLHAWAYEKDHAKPRRLLQLLMEWDVTCVLDMICEEDNGGDNPLAAAIIQHNFDHAKDLYAAYHTATNTLKSPTRRPTEVEKARRVSSERKGSPWTRRNYYGDTPFLVAIYEKCEETWLMEILSENPTVSYIHNNKDRSLLYTAILHGYHQIAVKILEEPDCELFSMPLLDDGSTVLHLLSFTSVETARVLLQKFWWLIDKTDKEGKTPREKAEAANNDPGFPLNLLFTELEKNPNSIKRTFYEWSTLISASKRGQLLVLLPYFDHNPDIFKMCLEQEDTPLHHIKLGDSIEYDQFLDNKAVKKMKNVVNSDNATPLHRAVEREDKVLVETLLKLDGVNTIEDKKGTMELLAKLAKDDLEWVGICQRTIAIDPRIKTRFIYTTNKNSAEIRGTLSVIAALLATITFAAGFTVPGGFKSDASKGDLGEAVFVKEPQFLAFLVADTIAMCLSMLVLFLLMWSMMCDTNMAVKLIDHSVWILMLALVGTLVAFMTGVYSIIFHNALGAAIFIIVLCSIIAISVIVSVRLFKYVRPMWNNYMPGVIKKLKRGNRKGTEEHVSLEQGRASGNVELSKTE